jgi:23S rRNA-/tRNA-specific pseudouridylate synthase
MYGAKIYYPCQIQTRDPVAEEPLLARCALHAWKLELNHPVTGQRMEFTAPLPDDMQRFVDELRKHRKR